MSQNNSVKENPHLFRKNNISPDIISRDTSTISGSNNVLHRGVVMNGRALGPGAGNTHFFDGKLASPDSSFMSLIEESTAKDIIENIDRASKITKNVKTRAFAELDTFIHQQKKYPVPHGSTRCLRAIANIHDVHGRTKTPGNQNYSPTDDLHACDLLYLLYEKIIEEKNEEYLKLILSQLDEMTTGLCAQGRANRLFQTYAMLRDDLTPTSKPLGN